MRTTIDEASMDPPQVAHSVLGGRGESFDTTFNGEPARIGSILPNAEVPDYIVSSPKVLLVTGGEITLGGQSYTEGELVAPPIDEPTHLRVGPEAFTYISRKADIEVHTDIEDRLARLASVGVGDTLWWSLPRKEQFARLEALIGNTPLEQVRLENGQTVFVKQEFNNPSGSHYDRVYFATIKHFEAIGFIQPGDELRDITSGSAGISLALMSYLLGYRSRITAPSELPANRLYPMLRFGAQVINSGVGYVPQASRFQTEEILQLEEDPDWTETRPADRSGRAFLFTNGSERICYLNHSENELSPQAFRAIAEELAAQAANASHIVLAKGNWTTIAGISPTIRKLLPGIEITGYSGELHNGSTQNYGTDVPDVPIRFRDPALLDDEVLVTDDERDTMISSAPDLGRSSLMGLAVAERILQAQPDTGVVTIGYDLANRY